MRKWFYLLLAVFILAAAIPLAGCSESKSEEPYKIGALVRRHRRQCSARRT